MPALTLPDSPLTDGVVTLRPWLDADIPALVAMANDPDIARFTRLPSPYSERDALQWLTTHEPLLRRGEALPLAIADAGSGELVGSMGLRMRGEGRGDVGYFVAAHARGRGIGTRALRVLSRWAFDELGLARLEVTVEPENTASLALAERAGFTREGVLRAYSEINGRRADFVMLSLLPADLMDSRRGEGPPGGRL